MCVKNIYKHVCNPYLQKRVIRNHQHDFEVVILMLITKFNLVALRLYKLTLH